MSKSMVSKYISKKWDEISKDTTEYKAYSLGLAVGYYQLYEYIRQTNGQALADTFIEDISNDMEEFYKLLKELIMIGSLEATNS